MTPRTVTSTAASTSGWTCSAWAASRRGGRSQFGLLDAFLSVDAPIILDPDTGLAVTDLHGEIKFGESLPSLTDPRALAIQNANPPGQKTLLEWKNELEGQVATAVANAAGGTPDFSDLTREITVDAGATLYSAYVSQHTFKLEGDLQFSTNGIIEASGRLTLGDSLTVAGGIYVDASQIAWGRPRCCSTPTSPSRAFRGRLRPTPAGVALRRHHLRLRPVRPRQAGRRLDHGEARHRADPRRLDPVRLGPGGRPEQHVVYRRVLGPPRRFRRAETIIDQGDGAGLLVGFDAQDRFVVSSPGNAPLSYAHG